MSARHETFAVGEHPQLSMRLAFGDVRVLPGVSGNVEVTARGSALEQLIIEQVGDTVSVRQETGRWTGGSLDITIHAPEGVDVEASLASTDLTVEVETNDLQVNVASGDVRTRRVDGDATIKSASGDVDIDDVGGRLRVTSASGDVSVGAIGGTAHCSTASGEIAFGIAHGDVTAKSASGDVRIDEFRGADLRGKTVSGDLRVGLGRGQKVDVDLQTLSGKIRLPSPAAPSEGDERPTVHMSFKSVSGDFELIETPGH